MDMYILTSRTFKFYCRLHEILTIYSMCEVCIVAMRTDACKYWSVTAFIFIQNILLLLFQSNEKYLPIICLSI